MKTFSTLLLALGFSYASFATGDTKLMIAAESNIAVTVDGNRWDQAGFNNSVTLDQLKPGFHSLKVYAPAEGPGRFRQRGGSANYQLLYNGSINIKPFVITRIALDRYGNAELTEQPLRGNFDEARHERYGAGNDRYNRSYSDNQYDETTAVISDEDFFAAERVMDRENDNGRLLYAKRLVDNNYLRAEQVKELARFFSFDANKFDFVKYAYANTIDKDNYRVVAAAFASADGRAQLMDFLRTCR